MSYDAWRISFQSSEQAARTAYSDVVKLNARVAELENDAARYRWLKQRDLGIGHTGHGEYRIYAYSTPDRYGANTDHDSVIDEAMSREA